jgi:hypothetical protein
LVTAAFERGNAILLKTNIALVRLMGPRWAAWRTGYALRRKLGLLKRRFPTDAWDSVTFADLVRDAAPADPPCYRTFREQSPARFFFPLGAPAHRETLERILADEARRRTLRVADDFVDGRFLYYSRHAFDLGRPVNWLLNPFTNAQHHARTHWCDYPTFSPELGDIKDVWEPSRFGCAFWLARAYALTGEQRYAESFWQFFDSWCEQNPPNRGPNWKCGQETALRMMAWLFALHVLWNADATTPERVEVLVRMIAIQADRIANNIDYAVSQKNNHALSEAAGVLTVGLLFPELRGAARWEALGRRVLEREVRRQIYADGSYVQHSMTYHRVMLHDCLWAMRLAELNGRPLSRTLVDRVARAGGFLFEMMDPDSGDVPNYGANDGALVLPLHACDYRDFRPTVQAARYGATQRRILPAGPWDEPLLWLYGEDALTSPIDSVRPRSRRFDAGGYYTIRTPAAWAMIRCHSYVDRPGHVDMLHVDVWHRGVNVLGDSGTYKYYTPENPALAGFFKDIRAHNTVEIDGQPPLRLVSQFLYLPWPRGDCVEAGDRHFVGQHDAYARAPWHVTHRRRVQFGPPQTWTITDNLLGDGTHDVVLRWHLADCAFTCDAEQRRVTLTLPDGPADIQFDAPAPCSLAVLRGAETGQRVMGWTSRYYAERTPRPTIELRVRLTLPATLTTTLVLPAPVATAAQPP